MTEHPNDQDFEIAEYCGNLACHKPIVQPAGRGRRREFCSEVCRRAADRDYKRAKKMVESFERNLRKTKHEVAAYGRRSETDGDFLAPDEEARVVADARVALSRAEALAKFAGADSGVDFRQELALVVEALRPALKADLTRLSA